jgi:hypothetical protein
MPNTASALAIGSFRWSGKAEARFRVKGLRLAAQPATFNRPRFHEPKPFSHCFRLATGLKVCGGKTD